MMVSTGPSDVEMQVHEPTDAGSPGPAESGVSRPTATVLRPGENCWRVERANRFAMLVDAQSCFSAIREALKGARHTVFILGWDIDSRMELTPGAADDGYPAGIRDFLNELVRRRRGLRIYVLSWDFAMVYALEREWLPAVKLDWRTHRRLSFRLDARHPLGASHHQKVVAIDGEIAFTGGLDLTRCRWDTPDHAPGDPLRRDPDGKPYPPFHDVHAMVDGPAAAALGELAAARWQRATHRRPRTTPRWWRATAERMDAWPSQVEPDLTEVDVGIARTAPAYGDESGVGEIRAFYLDAIASARKSIYLENQYFSSAVIADALAERLRTEAPPDIALLSRRAESGWLEENSMGVLRARLVRRLSEEDPSSRFRLYCPTIPGLDPECVNVHSKVMVVDDALITIGSANLSNRSLGLDTECNLVIESAGDSRIAAGIRRMRGRLLGEHLAVEPAEVEKAIGAHGGLHAAIAALQNPGGRTVESFVPVLTDEMDAALPSADLLDPIEPVDPELVMSEFVTHEARPRVAGRIGMLVLFAMVLAGVTFAWRFTPLRDWADFRSVLAMVEQFDELPFAPLAMMAVFVIGSLTMIPVTVMILVTIVVFGPLLGAIYATCGALLGASAGYGVGRWAGRDAVRRFGGRRLNQLSTQVGAHGLLAMIVLRMVPVAPFTLVNLVVGASRISLRDCLLGTLIGMTPGIVIAASLIDRIGALVRHPDIWSVLLLLLVLMVPIGAVVWLRRRRRRGEAAAAEAVDAIAADAGRGSQGPRITPNGMSR